MLIAVLIKLKDISMINNYKSGDLFALENLLIEDSNFSYGILIKENTKIIKYKKITIDNSWKALLDGKLVDVLVDSIYFHQL